MKRFRERMMAINMWVEARFRCGVSVWDRMSTAYQVIWIIMWIGCGNRDLLFGVISKKDICLFLILMCFIITSTVIN